MLRKSILKPLLIDGLFHPHPPPSPPLIGRNDRTFTTFTHYCRVLFQNINNIDINNYNINNKLYSSVTYFSYIS